MDDRTGLLNSSAHHHAHLGNTTQMHNATNGTLDKMADFSAFATDSEAFKGEFIMACVIFGIIFAFLLAVVAIDMRAKYRTGELHDDLRGIKNALVLMLKVIPMLLVALFSKIASLIPRKQAEPTEADSAAAMQKARESQAIVQRLAAKSPSTDTTTSVPSVVVPSADVASVDVASVDVASVDDASVDDASVDVAAFGVALFGIGSFGDDVGDSD